MTILLPFILVLAIIYIVPMIVYGIGSAVVGLKIPEEASPQTFLVSVLISKIGTTFAFILIFYLAKSIFDTDWILYAAIWFAMFAFGEVGQAIAPNYSWKEAAAGIVSESFYFPLAAFVASWLI